MNTSSAVITATTTGIAVSVTGVSTAAASTATIIASTGGAAAVILVGYGLYKWLSK